MGNISLFENLVKNKSIAFVGLAPNISGKKLGKEIDSFDTVIRSYPILPKLYDDYGTKCDIISLNNVSIDKHLDHLKDYKKMGMKGLVTYKNIKDHFKKDIEFYCITEKNRLEIKKYVQKVIGSDPHWPTNGIYLLYYCLQYKCKNFKMFGVTGYQDKNGKVCEFSDANGSNHYIMNIDNVDFAKRGFKGHSYHNYQAHNDFLRILLKNGRIEMDKYSREYFI